MDQNKKRRLCITNRSLMGIQIAWGLKRKARTGDNRALTAQTSKVGPFSGWRPRPCGGSRACPLHGPATANTANTGVQDTLQKISMFLEQFRAKLREKYTDFPSAHPQLMQSLPHCQHPRQSGTCVLTDEPTLIRSDQLESIV